MCPSVCVSVCPCVRGTSRSAAAAKEEKEEEEEEERVSEVDRNGDGKG